MTKGEEVKVNIHYDLFGHDVYNRIGVFVSTTLPSKKLLVYFPEFEDWGEFLIEDVTRMNPDVASTENLKFIKRVKKLEYSLLSLAC